MDEMKLLKKYMAHVLSCEGESFVSDYHFSYGYKAFTKKEKALLCKLNDELRNQ